MKRLIIYDLDGTLVDTLEDITLAANEMLRVMQAPAASPREVRGYVGRGVQQVVKGCLKTDGPAQIEHGIKVFRAFYARHLLDHSRLYPRAKEVLEYFKRRNQAVITNKPNPFAGDILRALGVEQYFVSVIAGESEYPKKPNPTSVQAIMSRCGVKPEETLLVGDSPVDIETGRNAGALTIGLTHGFSDEDELTMAAPDFMARNFEDLLKLAKQQGW